MTNISLDLFGQVRHYFQYAAKIGGAEKTEDHIAFLRLPHAYKNTLLVEQPNTDFAYIIARQFFYDNYHLLLLGQLMNSKDKQISAIATKSIKEVKYHVRFSSQWVKRLGDGTLESHQRMQKAIDYLYPYTEELFQETPIETAMKEEGIGADLINVKQGYLANIKPILEEATLTFPDNPYSKSGGKTGIHSEHLGFILTDLQYMQRTYPNMEW